MPIPKNETISPGMRRRQIMAEVARREDEKNILSFLKKQPDMMFMPSEIVKNVNLIGIGKEEWVWNICMGLRSQGILEAKFAKDWPDSVFGIK